MKAISVDQFGGPEVMKTAGLPKPAAGSGQVLVRIHAAGVNPVEAYIRSGAYARKPSLPYTPGTDGAGIVEESGADAFAPGDRVYIAGSLSGSYAEFALCEAAQVHPLPVDVSFEEGAALGVPYATAYRALFHRGRALPGETVLIHGASGGVGIAAVQLARAYGLRVFGTAGTGEGCRLVLEQGAHQVFNHREADYLARLAEATGGIDLIVEMLANVNLGHDLELLARHGRVVVVGNRGSIEIDPRQTMARDADIRGTSLVNATPEELADTHAALFKGLENKTLRPVIRARLPLEQAPGAHRAIMDAGALGKYVLIP